MTKWTGPWSNCRAHRKKEIVILERAVFPEVIKYLRRSICNLSIFKIELWREISWLYLLSSDWKATLAFKWLLTLLKILTELPSEMCFTTFSFKFVGSSLIIHHFYIYGTPWLVFISKSHVFLRELKLFLPKHSK